MSKQRNKNDRDWSRCFEGFTDLTEKKGNAAVKQKREPNNRRTKTSFGRGNIFENLGLQPEEDTSQSITWSSSDEDKAVTKSPQLKKRKKSEATKRSTQSLPKLVEKKPRERSAFDSLNIQADSDPEIANAEAGSVTSSQKSQNAGIQSYDSEQESSKSPAIKEEHEEKHDSQPSPSIIESLTSSAPSVSPAHIDPSSTQPNCKGSQGDVGLKASAWVKTLQLKTPTKSDPTADRPNVEDSGKKKKKHSRGGLAEQLSRLQARDKSSVRMWSHQQSKPSSSQDSKSITLEVTGFETLYSMQLVKCSLYPPSAVVETPETPQDSSPLSSQSKNTADSQSKSGTTADQSQRLVMFPASQSEQMNIAVGTCFTVFPPWQELQLHAGRCVMLCTKYCQVVKQPDEGVASGAEVMTPCGTQNISTNLEKYTQVKASWNCPCVQGLCKNQTLCPAYKFPCTPGIIQPATPSVDSKDLSEKDKNSNNVKFSEPVNNCHRHLQTISCAPVKPDLLTSVTVCTSLLESIEACRSSKDGDTGNGKGVCFQGRVHRAVCSKDKSGEMECRILMEDNTGTVCEVHVSMATFGKFNLEPVSCQGRLLTISGLKVHERVVREREPALFSMVDLVWSRTTASLSQDGNQSQNSSNCKDTACSAEPPGFCYILHDDPSCALEMKVCGDVVQPDSMKLEWCPVADVLKKPSLGTRCNCVAKIVHAKNDLNSLCVLYAADRSMVNQQQYVKVLVQPTCDFRYSSSDSKYIALRDAFIHSGTTIYADHYTQVCTARDISGLAKVPASHAREYLEKVGVNVTGYSSSLQDGDLCSIQGSILEVDEDSAYSWEVCPDCNSDLVLQDDSMQGQSECRSCVKMVENPVTKMKMEVIVRCRDADVSVKVDLLQSTIEALLPQDEEDEDGYELTSVLNKDIGPLYCVVTLAGTTKLLKEITLLE